jgi:hypothetical protein
MSYAIFHSLGVAPAYETDALPAELHRKMPRTVAQIGVSVNVMKLQLTDNLPS